jgi:Cytochrome c554 and c-prime
MQVFYKQGRFLIMLLLLFLSNCQCAEEENTKGFFAKDNSDAFALLFTTNMRGYIEPCGCTSDPLGGLDRLAFVVEKARQSFRNRLLFVDAGNLFFDSAQKRTDIDLCQDEAKLDILLSTYQKLKVAGTLPGPFDQSRGYRFYRSFLQKYQISILNEMPRIGQILDQSGVKIGLIGLSSAIDFTKEARRLKDEGALIVVVIAQAPSSIVRTWFQGVEDVDIVILGQEMSEIPSPPELLSEHGPWLVSAAMQGQYLGIVEFRNISLKKAAPWQMNDSFDKNERRSRLLQSRQKSLKRQVNDSGLARRSFLEKQLRSIDMELDKNRKMQNIHIAIEGPHLSVRTLPLRKGIKPLFDVQKKLLAYEKSVPHLVAKCEANTNCQPVKSEQPTYVGVQTCKNCHVAAVNVWENAEVEIAATDEGGLPIKRRSGHALAWSTLEKKHKAADRNCIGCHSVGFMEPGGYCKVKEIDFRKNVQCESCHGPGSLHAVSGDKKWIKRDVPESTCRTCHHVPHIETTASFVYEDKLKLILGKGHGENLLMRLNHGSLKAK